jgi:hemerythrin superfamily protein
MPTTAKTKARKEVERKSKRSRAAPDGTTKGKSISAVELLEQDHRDVERCFEDYEDAKSDREKSDLSAKICLALTVHAHIEEEIFYPQARKATKDNDLLDEAAVEHAGAKHLIAEIQSMKVGDDLYDAKIRVLAEQIKHHVKEEEEELFPEVEKAKMDLEAVGQQLAERKGELMSELEGVDAKKGKAS